MSDSSVATAHNSDDEIPCWQRDDMEPAVLEQIIKASLRAERRDLAKHLTERIERQSQTTGYGRSIRAELIRLKAWLESDQRVPRV